MRNTDEKPRRVPPRLMSPSTWQRHRGTRRNLLTSAQESPVLVCAVSECSTTGKMTPPGTTTKATLHSGLSMRQLSVWIGFVPTDRLLTTAPPERARVTGCSRSLRLRTINAIRTCGVSHRTLLTWRVGLWWIQQPQSRPETAVFRKGPLL